MTIMLKLDFGEGPKPPKDAARANRPHYVNNYETRDHLSGKRLSRAVLKLDLERLCTIWINVQRDRQRNAVYEFLEAVYALVSRFNRTGKGEKLLKTLRRMDARLERIQESYAAVIHHSTSYALDGRTRSKWSRLLRNAEGNRQSSHQLEEFIRKCGGINACAMHVP